MKAFIFHCWGGNGRSCWSGHLHDELEKKGIPALSPDFPDTDNPVLGDWLSHARSLVPRFEEKDGWVLVSHSLGGPTILRLLETFGKGEKAKAVILVAGFAKDLGIPQVRGFVEKEFDWEKIRRSADKFIVISSDNDPFIPLEEGRRMAGCLGPKCEFIVEKGAGHINEGAGFTKYPRVLDAISALASGKAGKRHD